MSLFMPIFGAIFAFFIIVLIHESGHFFVARFLGVKVLQFSIGFGRAIYTRTGKSGVQYAIRILPLGGYVQMDDGSADAKSKGSAGQPLSSKSLWVRTAVVLAGPLINLVFAVFLFWGLYVAGVTEIKPIVGRVIPNSIAAKGDIKSGDQITQVGGWATHNWQQVLMSFFMQLGAKEMLPVHIIGDDGSKLVKRLSMHDWQYNPDKPALLQSIGIVPMKPKINPIIANVVARSPAANKLIPGDTVIFVNQEKISDWMALVSIIQKNPGKKLTFTITRDGIEKVVAIEVGSQEVGGKAHGYLGISPRIPEIPSDLKLHVAYPLLTGWQPAVLETWRLIAFHFFVVKQMVVGNISLKALGGPITIFKTAGQASSDGLRVYVGFLALISVVIGVLNLLPIPGLDGGHLLFYCIEAVIRQPIPVKVQHFITVLGVGFLIFLMSYATLNDLFRIFS